LLVSRADWILSDGTGPSPKELERGGFLLETFGRFEGPHVPADPKRSDELVRLFRSRRERMLPFRFGAFDAARNYHLIVAHKEAWTPPPLVELAETSGSTTSTRAMRQPPEHPEEWKTWRPGAEPDARPMEVGGVHQRLSSEGGPIHVWRPARYRSKNAGIVIYLHGYFSTLDQAWIDHHLPEQFDASGRNALFIAPEAAAGDEEDPPWEELGDLLAEVKKKVELPPGPLVVVAHSGGYRGLIHWLDDARISELVLLDALYGHLRELREWARADHHRTILVGIETDDRSAYVSRMVPGAAREEHVPASAEDLPAEERSARLLSFHSQFEHMEIVTGQHVIPLVLSLSVLPATSSHR
jgi:hypothetical protein